MASLFRARGSRAFGTDSPAGRLWLRTATTHAVSDHRPSPREWRRRAKPIVDFGSDHAGTDAQEADVRLVSVTMTAENDAILKVHANMLVVTRIFDVEVGQPWRKLTFGCKRAKEAAGTLRESVAFAKRRGS